MHITHRDQIEPLVADHGEIIEGIEHRLSLLPGRGDVAADAAESLGPCNSAERAGDLLLDFDHSQVSLALIVSKGTRKSYILAFGINKHSSPPGVLERGCSSRPEHVEVFPDPAKICLALSMCPVEYVGPGLRYKTQAFRWVKFRPLDGDVST
jgi:hypothetical protein